VAAGSPGATKKQARRGGRRAGRIATTRIQCFLAALLCLLARAFYIAVLRKSLPPLSPIANESCWGVSIMPPSPSKKRRRRHRRRRKNKPSDNNSGADGGGGDAQQDEVEEEEEEEDGDRQGSLKRKRQQLPGQDDDDGEEDDDDEEEEEEEHAGTGAAASAAETKKQQSVLDALHREMEIADYGKAQTGQARRKLTRQQSKTRTRKRKLLEKRDREEQRELMEVTMDALERNPPPRQQQPQGEVAGESKSAASGADDADAAAVPVAAASSSSASSKRRKRLRGPKAAAEALVIEGSHVFRKPAAAAVAVSAAATSSQRRDGSGGGKDDNDEREEDEDEEEVDMDEEEEQAAGDEEEEEIGDLPEDDEASEVEEDDDGDDAEDDAVVEEEVPVTASDASIKGKKKAPGTSSSSTTAAASPAISVPVPNLTKRNRRKKRVFGRLQNFKSFRMAERHGDALGAHAQGRHRDAIQQLKELARDAPSAPQVYFSLGMVYEAMLQECKNKYEVGESTNRNGAGDAESEDDSDLDGDGGGVQNTAQNGEGDKYPESQLQHRGKKDGGVDSAFTEQLDLATKAYGSYHVAAILCKKDWSIWLRAADVAVEIADLHTLAASSNWPSSSSTTDDTAAVAAAAARLDHHRSERQRWLTEAKSDYQAADNQKPPGIDIPAKLATVLMELGHLSEGTLERVFVCYGRTEFYQFSCIVFSGSFVSFLRCIPLSLSDYAINRS